MFLLLWLIALPVAPYLRHVRKMCKVSLFSLPMSNVLKPSCLGHSWKTLNTWRWSPLSIQKAPWCHSLCHCRILKMFTLKKKKDRNVRPLSGVLTAVSTWTDKNPLTSMKHHSDCQTKSNQKSHICNFWVKTIWTTAFIIFWPKNAWSFCLQKKCNQR